MKEKEMNDINEKIWQDIIKGLSDKGSDNHIVDFHHSLGNPVYQGCDEYPDRTIKLYPDGKKEVIYFDDNGNEIVEKVITVK